MDKEEPTQNWSKDGLLLVKGQPFAGLSEKVFAPSELFQTSSPAMIHCCELICHVNLMQQNVNRLHFALAKKQVFTGDCLHGGKPFRRILPLLLPIQTGGAVFLQMTQCAVV